MERCCFTQDGNESLLSTTIVSILEKENPEAELHLHVDPGLKGICGTNFALCMEVVLSVIASPPLLF